ncbi:probable G-protein coupled receptor 160 [Eleutherodactylus coqui]|uniref:probable G-protein coupled receptor 160 n=1 Tax=Eleutherodactylus coqui TaxID=57060 RepID=UPI0034629718
MYSDPVFISISVTDNASDPDRMIGGEVPPTDWRSLEPSCILILIITGKVIMNLFIFRARQSYVSGSLMGYCCISLAIVDFLLLFTIYVIHYFQDFNLMGFRFTTYHVCLFTQIVSHTYGILHVPFFLASGLDYYLTVVLFIRIPCSRLLYTACVVLLWTGAFAYVFLSPAASLELDADQSSYQCNFYISSQSFYLSISLVCSVLLLLILCSFEMVTFLKSLKVITYAESTVVLFSLPTRDRWPVRGGKCFMTALLFSFLGTWAPFIGLQIIIFVLCAHIPGYMDMNVPWLYFMNSFLIAVSFGLKYPDLQVTEKTFSRDPFIGWKYCVLPFMDAEHNKAMSFLKESPSSVMII